MHTNCKILERYKEEINEYLIKNLKIELYPSKSKIIELKNGVNLLGYRIFYCHKLLRKANKRKFNFKFSQNLDLYRNGTISCEEFIQKLQGWFGYAVWANTYKLRKNIIKTIEKI